MSSIDGSIFSSLGVGSGLDLSSLLSNLKQADEAQLQPLKNQKASFNTKLSAYGKIQNSVDNLSDAAKTLGKSSLFDANTANTDATGFSAKADDTATPGSYRVQVNQLAQRQTLVTAVDNGKASASQTLGNAGTLTLSTGSGADAQTVNIDLDASQTSLNGIRDAINASDSTINASVINDGSDTPYRLVLTAGETGTDSQISVAADSSTGLAGLLNYDSSDPSAAGNALDEAASAQDADITVNGIAIKSQSNTVKSALPGVTLSLNQTTDAPERVDVSRDTDKVVKAVKQFVEAYNSYRETTDKLTKFNGADANNGALIGDSVARTVASRLRSALTPTDAGGDYASLGQIGLSLDKSGEVSLDTDKLTEALNTNRSGVRQLLAGDDSADGADGVADALANTTSTLLQTGGLLLGAEDGLQTRIQNTQDTIDQRQDNIDARIARQRTEFEQLDKTVASLNQTQSYLSQQLASLNGSSSGGSGGSGGGLL